MLQAGAMREFNTTAVRVRTEIFDNKKFFDIVVP